MISRLSLLIATGLVCPVTLVAQQDAYSIEVVVGNGPHAGTYRVSPPQPCNHIVNDEHMGLYFDRLVDTQIDDRAAAATKALRDPKALNGIEMKVPNWNGKGAPSAGRIRVLFGPLSRDDGPLKGSTIYEVSTGGKEPDGSGTFTASDSKKLVSIEFEGQTARGIKLRLKGSCTNPVI